MGPDLPTVRTYINDFVKTHLDNFLHKNPHVAEALLKKFFRQKEKEKSYPVFVKLQKKELKKQAYTIESLEIAVFI
jgi:topoisomerase-4 subunit B